MIRLQDLKLIELLPSSIKNDETINALTVAIDSELNKVTNHIYEAMIISRIDELPEDLIDLLAWQFHVDFYEPLGIDLQKKRELIKNSIAFNRLKGTKGIVESILKILYSEDVSILEWFEYDGEPYTFKVKTNMQATEENMQNFFQILNTIKNTRSHLDGFVINTKSNMGVFYGQVTRVVSKTYIKMDSAKIDIKPTDMYIGQCNIFKQKIRINMDSIVIPPLKQENYISQATIIKNKIHVSMDSLKLQPLKANTHVSMGNFIGSKTNVKMGSIKLNLQKANKYIGQATLIKNKIHVSMDSLKLQSLKANTHVSMGNFIGSKTNVKMGSINVNLQKANNYIGQGIFIKTRVSIKEENNE